VSSQSERISLYEFMPYGAPELMEVARRYMFRATIAGIGVILLFFGSFFAVNAILAAREPKEIPVVQMQISDLAAPPPLSQDAPPPQVQVAPAAAPPAAAVPVPVPDAEAPPEQTIMSQEEISTSAGAVTEGTGEAQIVVTQAAEDEVPKLGEYVYVEELPEPITKVNPEYPDIARDAGVEGTVLVQALVGKDGRVMKTQVTKGVPMLNDAAEAAVKRWVFKPALSNNKPVVVWVAVPIAFKLH
jgi:protein TonB